MFFNYKAQEFDITSFGVSFFGNLILCLYTLADVFMRPYSGNVISLTFVKLEC